MLDQQTGVWLSHSTPRFPTYRRKDFWPESGHANAQTFLCVTYTYATFKEIGRLMPFVNLLKRGDKLNSEQTKKTL